VKYSGSKILLIIFLAGLLLRLGWALHQPNDTASLQALPDQVEYLSLGQNLLLHHTLFFYDHRFDQVVYAYRMPGYPIFIALCGGSPMVVRWIQAIIDASNIFAAYLLARTFLSRKNSLAAAALIAINPFLIYFSGLILSETLCTAMILWSIVLCLSKKNIAGPILIALSVLVRPSGLLLALLLPLVAGAKRIHIAIGLLTLILMLSLWAWRNQTILGKWIWLTTNDGITQYDGFNPNATGASNQQFAQHIPYLQQIDEVDRNAYLSTQAHEYMRTHPARIFSLAIAKLARTFSPVPLSEQFSRPMYLAIAAVYSLPVFFLALIGLLRGPGGSRMKLLLLTVPIYFALIHAFSVGSLRYRLPAEPFLAILAIAGTSVLTEADPSPARSSVSQ
jgi:4-amino-4-deoxy-L-arabinose transferase-like glycosyltransferase